MSASDITSRTAAAERVSLSALLGERNTWLLFALGFGCGLPGYSYWFSIFPRVDQAIDKALLFALIGFGVTGWVALAAAPFLDRYRAPGFAALGHRRSWVAASLCAGLFLVLLHAATFLASEGAAERFAAISGLAALTIFSFLWIAVDALRIDLYRGRAQAVAIAAQYFGALTAAALAGRFKFDPLTLQPALICGALLAISLAAALLTKEPASPSPPRTGSVLSMLARPWATFFARHGRASGLLLGALAFYAIAASIAEFLGKQGYLVELLRSDFRTYDQDISDALTAVGMQEIALTAIGIVVGMLIAFSMTPPRAFFVLMLSIAGLLLFFVLCKVELGFTVFTVAGLFAYRTLVSGASFVIYIVIAARMTARPDTAGHVVILALVSGAFWITETGMTALAPLLGSYALATTGGAAAAIAILLMHLASRAARRPG